MSKYYEKLKKIKESYEKIELPCDPYLIYDWYQIWTPIEKNVWGNIRLFGLPFYPEYPVGKYFLDFADPFKKIGIEVDEQKYHQDEEKDAKRQREIEYKGWTIYRIKGWMTFKDREDFFKDLEENQDLYDDEVYQEKLNELNETFKVECSEGILRNIRELYYRNNLCTNNSLRLLGGF